MVEKPHWLNTEDADIFDGQVLCNVIGSFGCTILWTYQIGIFLTPFISHRMATLLACGWMLVYWWPMFFVFWRSAAPGCPSICTTIASGTARQPEPAIVHK